MQSVVGTGAPDSVLIDLLKSAKWDPSRAVDNYFQAGYSDKYMTQAGAGINPTSV